MQTYLPTRSGVELLRIIEASPSKEFLVVLARTLNSKPFMKDHKVSLHRITHILGSSISYEERHIPLEEETIDA